jgi:hypothetical protein
MASRSAVGKAHRHLLGVASHVRIRQHVSILAHDEAGSRSAHWTEVARNAAVGEWNAKAPKEVQHRVIRRDLPQLLCASLDHIDGYDRVAVRFDQRSEVRQRCRSSTDGPLRTVARVIALSEASV